MKYGNIVLALIVCCSVLAGGVSPVMAQEDTSDDGQSVSELVSEMSGEEMWELVQTDPSELSEEEYRAVIIWIAENGYNFTDERSERFSSWTQSMEEQHSVSPDEIRDSYQQQTSSEEDSGADLNASQSSSDSTESADETSAEEVNEEDYVYVFPNDVRIESSSWDENTFSATISYHGEDDASVIVTDGGRDLSQDGFQEINRETYTVPSDGTLSVEFETEGQPQVTIDSGGQLIGDASDSGQVVLTPETNTHVALGLGGIQPFLIIMTLHLYKSRFDYGYERVK